MTIAEHDAYFLHHSIGQYPEKEIRLAGALTEFAEKWSAGGDQQWHYGEKVEREYLEKWARVIGASSENMAHSESVTSAVHTLITALPDATLSGKRVLVPEDSFPSLLFLLSGIADRYNFSLDIVPKRQGANWVECDDIADSIDDSVGLVMLNWVSSTSSHKCDVPRLTKLAHASDALVGIDLTQGAGIVPFDVAETPVDFAATTSLKWVCGVPGAGILYVDRGLIDQCEPERRGWFSQGNPFNWSLDEFSYSGTARKFHLGTPAVLGCVGTLPALDWLLSGDGEENRQANAEHASTIIDVAENLGFELGGPRERHRRGASVMLQLSSDALAKQAMGILRDRRVFADVRGPVLRLSPGLLNTAIGLTQLTDGLNKISRLN